MPALVQILQGFANQAGQLEGFGLRKTALARHRMGKGFAFEKFHHQIRPALAGGRGKNFMTNG